MAFLRKCDRVVFNRNLIEAVRKRPAIWNTKLSEHKETLLVKALWQEIAAEMNIDVATLTDKWRNMRDAFRKHLRLFEAKKDGMETGDVARVRWPYFEQMLFLNDFTYARRKLESNSCQESPDERLDACDSSPANFGEVCLETVLTISPTIDSHNCSSTDEPSVDIEVELPESIATKQTEDELDYVESSSLSKNKRRRIQCEILEKLSNHDEDIHSSSQKDLERRTFYRSEDEINCFLMSLSNDMHAVPKDLLLSLKMNMMYIISKYKMGIVPHRLLPDF